MHDSHAQLGLEPGATMHEIETAYWRFARELKGQAAMAPFNKAYETLVNRATSRATDARRTPVAPQEIPEKRITLVASPSKFGWPAN